MIKCLPKEVQGKLRSGVALPSLQQCVEELLLNGIDAGATCVGVRMDMDAFKVQVIDNGAGLSAEDMGCVGNRYYTSKCNSLDDLEDLRFYGFRGEALASIVSLATLVEIASKTKASMKTYVKIFREGKALDVFEAETARPSFGTTVTVCNYFHNMPVRRKRMDAVLENERIRQRVEAISLMHPTVSFTLKNDCTGAMVVQLPKARDTFYRFVQIHSLGRAQKLGEINYTSGQFKVTGYIGREGHYNNNLQFLYVNERLVLKTRIHKLLNTLLRRLSSSNQKTKSPDINLFTSSPKQKRNQDLYGVFIVNIKCPYSEYDICLEPSKTLIEFKDWDGVLRCIEETVKDFLKRENLEAELSQDDMECESPQTVDTNQTSTCPGTSAPTASGFPKKDCCIETALASESVYRTHKDMPVNMECDQLESKDGGEEQLSRKQPIERSKNISNSKLGTLIKHGSEATDLTTLNGEPEHIDIQDPSEKSSEILSTLHPQCLQDSKVAISFQSETNTTSYPCMSSTDVMTKETEANTSCPQNFVNIRKVSLSDPYIHESLETPEHCKPAGFEQEEKSFAPKRKISLETSRGMPLEDVFKGAAPVKIRKIISLSNISQSLDQFRRLYDKSEINLEDNSRQKSINFESLNHNQLLDCEKNKQDCFAKDTQKKVGHNHQSPPTLTTFTNLKPASCLNKEKKSIATKLYHLRQQSKTASFTVPTSNTTTEVAASIGEYCVQSNNNLSTTDIHPEPGLSHGEDSQLLEEEQETTIDDWLSHYDPSVGKKVYVNKVTGLSRYGEPSFEHTQVRCTSDVTNMAVSVVSETGMECVCYPFQMDIVLPFLPKSRTERVCWSEHDDRGVSVTGGDDENSNSLYSMYSKWNNPVFVKPPKVGVDISCGQADGLAVKVHNILFPYRFSKSMIPTMQVINQVDKKFLACLINARDDSDDRSDSQSEPGGNLLVLVDQHAAHERVRLENLITDAYEDNPDVPGEKHLCSSTITPPLEIIVLPEEQRLLRSCGAQLQSLGLGVSFSQAADSRLFVRKVPLCFTEKDMNERKRGRPSVIKLIVEEYLQEQIELLRSAGRVRGTLPLTVQKVLASFACHGAIKFNDTLNKDECSSLVASLSACQLPFQCAHGRPSIAPLVDLHHIDKEKEMPIPNLSKLRGMYKAWKLFGNR